MSNHSPATSQNRQNTNYLNPLSQPHSMIEEIRMNLRHPQPIKKISTAHRLESHLHHPSISPHIQPYSYDDIKESNDKSNPISHINITNASPKLNDMNKAWQDQNENFSQSLEESDPYDIIRNLIGLYDLLDLDRQKANEESRRLKSINNELTAMLQNSNTREEQNNNELNKQRKYFSHWQSHFSKLKEDASKTISTLFNHRQKLLENLKVANDELKRLTSENEMSNNIIKKLEHDSQMFQKYFELYQVTEQDKRSRENDCEALKLRNSKLMNERNAIESDRNRLQSIVDELEAEKNSKDVTIPLMLNKTTNLGTSIPQLADQSPFEQISEAEMYAMINQFENSNHDQKKLHFEELLDQLRNVAATGARYWEYTQFLMSELDNRGIQPNSMITNTWNLEQN